MDFLFNHLYVFVIFLLIVHVIFTVVYGVIMTRKKQKYATIEEALLYAVVFRSPRDEDIMIRVVDHEESTFSGFGINSLEWYTISFDEVDLNIETFLGLQLLDIDDG